MELSYITKFSPPGNFRSPLESMNLTPDLEKRYTRDNLSAREAQRQAQFIAWGPVVFEATRAMLRFGILDMLRDAQDRGLTRAEIVAATGRSDYAIKCLLEASLSIGTVIVDPKTERYTLTKTGWFLLTDNFTRVNIDFNHDVNYLGWHRLEDALAEGRPAGLSTFGDWPTIYEGLSKLPHDAQKSWLAFDHLYSDASFPKALEIVFDNAHSPRTLFDVGGNTGRWATQCVAYNNDVEVTILDLPGQIGMMREAVKGEKGAERIHGYGINILDESNRFPESPIPDAIWMSQFLDCFSMPQIVSILRRAAEVMQPHSRLYIMETLWDRQKYETATLALTMTSLYFTALANGNSKMYNTEDLVECINAAGLEVETMHDNLGLGHTLLVCRLH